jgi:adenosylcobinamide-GDP ribazoletransferase
MEVSIDQTKWYDRILASLIFFTRLPFWRLRQPPVACYQTVVEHWPLTGWLTGGAMGLTLYFATLIFPGYIGVLLAILVRILITGALHEDGLADFIDGFGGGGSDRQRILCIMKDSHIGTYGVLGLIFYFLILTAAIYSIPPYIAAVLVFAADPYSKMVTSQMILMMPYARKEEEAKSKTIYRKFGPWAGLSLAVQGLLPMIGFIFIMGFSWEALIFLPAVVMYMLYLFIWSKLRGYTGDCCGAVCLLVELSIYLYVCASNYLWPL